MRNKQEIIALMILIVLFLGKSVSAQNEIANSENTLKGADTFTFQSRFPRLTQITYKDRDGKERTVWAFPGLVIIIMETTVSQNDAKALFKTNGGKVLQINPKSGEYIVGVDGGSESKFIAAMYKDNRVKDAFPVSDKRKALEVIPDYATVAYPDESPKRYR